MKQNIRLFLKTTLLLAILLFYYINTSFANNTLNYVISARQFNSTFNYTEANKQYKLALKQNKNNLDLLQEYLLFLVHQQDLPKAVSVANLIVLQNNQHFLSNMVLFVNLINQNKLESALQKLQTLSYVENSLADFIIKLTIATNEYINYSQNNFIELSTALQHNNYNATGEFDDFYEYHTALLDLIYNRKNFAKEKLKLVTINALSIQSVLLYTQLLYKTDREQAKTIFKDYLGDSFLSNNMVNQYLRNYQEPSLSVFFSSVFLKLSALVSNETNINFLTSEYSTLISLSLMLNKNNYLSYIALASHYYNIGDINKSASTLMAIPTTNYYSKIATYDIIELLKFNNKNKLLLSYLNKTLATDKQNPFLYLEKGHFYHTQKQYNKAIKQYNIALNLALSQNMRLGTWLSYYFKGISEDKNNNWPTAEQDFLKALAIDNQDPLLVNYLAYSWLSRDMNIEKSFNMLKELVKTNSNNASILDSYAFALLKTKDYKNALIYSQKAYKINPYNPVVVDHLADLYWLNNNKKQAIYYWNLALNLSNDMLLNIDITDKLNNILPKHLQNK